MPQKQKIKDIHDPGLFSIVHNGVVLVDFWATWCEACGAQEMILEELAAANAQMTIAKVNIDHNPKSAARYGVKVVPTLILFKDGRPLMRFIGVQGKNTLSEAVRQAVGCQP
jgi:thioredoxin 1